MSLKEKLMVDLKDAMKSKDKLKKDTITLVRSAIKQIEVDERRELDDSDIEALIQKQVKERRSSIEEFKKANRDDLVTQSEKEIELLMTYLPEQLTEEELIAIVKQSIIEADVKSPKDMGNLMKNVMPKVKGRADGKMVNKIAQELLSKPGE